MAKLRLGGQLTGVAVPELGYIETINGHNLLVHTSDIDISWEDAPDDRERAESELLAWLDTRLLAMSLTTGLPASYVEGRWTEFTPADGRTRVGGSFGFAYSVSYQSAKQLGGYESLAGLIESDDDLRKAVDRYRRAMALTGNDDDAVMALAYLGAEGLVALLAGTGGRGRWPPAAQAVGMTPDDLTQLWASTQFGRHDEARRRDAADILTSMGRPPLSANEVCQRYREFVRAFIRTRHGVEISP